MSEFQQVLMDHSASVVEKGRKTLEKGGVTPDEVSLTIWYVDGSRPGRPYRVQLVDGPVLMCSCPNGQAKGGQPTCYHTAAVALMLQEAEAERVAEGYEEEDF